MNPGAAHPGKPSQDSIRGAAFDEKMRPRLAIARAHRKQVLFEWHPWRERASFDAHHPNAKRRSGALSITVDMGREHGVKHPGGFDDRRIGAQPSQLIYKLR